ncbi:MAG: flavoprotein, partial [Planctomycetota bacterium]
MSSVSVPDADKRPWVVAITGASGAVYAQRLLQFLALSGDREIHLTMSPSGAAVLKQELDLDIALAKPDLAELLCKMPAWLDDDGKRRQADQAAANMKRVIRYHHYQDY